MARARRQALKVPQGTRPQKVEIKQFTGMNMNTDVTQIADGESPEMLNIILDNDGTPDKRPGYEKAFRVPLRG